MRSTSKHPHKLVTPVALVAIMVLACLLRMNFWDQPLQTDEGIYGYMAWSMPHGLVPYKDIYDHKPPGIYLLYRLAFLFFEPTALSIKVFATIYTLGTVLALFFLAKNLAGNTAGYLAALLFAIFSCGPKIEGGGVNTEIFMILPYTLAAYSLFRAVETNRRRDFLLTGLWTGLATTIKQVAVVNLLWVGAYLSFRLWQERQSNAAVQTGKNGLLVLIGATLPWIPYGLYFYLKDALSQFFYWQVSYNLNYVAKGYQSIANYAVFNYQTKDIFHENGFLWLLAVAGAAWLWKELWKPAGAGLEAKPQGWRWSVFFLMSTWPLFSFFGVALGGRFFGHYYIQTIPSLAVLGGLGCLYLYHQVRHRGLEIIRSPLSLVLTLLFAKAFLLFVITDAPFYVKYNGDQISLNQYRTPLFSVTRFIGNYLRPRTNPGDLVYVWAVNPEINFYAARRSPSPFLIPLRTDKSALEEVMEALYRSPPKYIVAMQEMKWFPQLEKYVNQNYYKETNGELDELRRLSEFEIYRRKER